MHRHFLMRKLFDNLRNREKENPDQSTDDDEIEEKIEKLFELLEKGVQDEEKSFDKRRKYLHKVCLFSSEIKII